MVRCCNRVEAAFKKFDTDGDGFLDWKEFKQENMRNNEQNENNKV